jgi:uncharacterized delta-60 repeat protein
MIPLIRSIFASFAILAAGLLPHFSPSAQAAEIQVLGNSLEIVDGDSIPRVEDRTFFGLLTLGAGSLTQTFTIKNLSTTAGDNLNLTGTPRVVIGGANPGDYVVTTQPADSVAPGGSTTFVITWTPTFGDTIHRATLSIANNDSNENPYDFAIEATVTLTLNYAAGPNGSLSGDVAQGGFEARTAVTAVPNSGYHFVNWSDGSAANPRIDLNVTQNVNVTANFAIGGYTLAYTAGANGSIAGTTPQTVIHGASGTAVNAVPATGYSFVNWSDGFTANPRTDSNVMRDVSVTANFAINTYTLTYAAGANGSLIGTTPQTVNHGASGTAVTAVPATGYHFVNWSDGSTANPRTDTNVTAIKSVTATFAINTYTLTYIAGPYGVISGTTPQTVTHGASGTIVFAVAAANARFVNWSDGSTANPRTDTNVTAAKSVTAQFELKAPPPPVPTVTLNGPATVTIGVDSAYSELGAFSGPSALTAGDSHSLALRSDGTVAAWGNNGDGQTTITPGLSNVVALASGYYHNLALRSNGTVAAWGRNFDGQTTIPASLSNVVAISAGHYHNLALRSSGTIVAWGSDYLGQATIPPGLNNVVAIAAGGAHSLALRYDGAVVAWGYGGSGQTTIPLGLNNVIAIAAGGGHSLALRYDGTVAAWGYGASGQATTPAGLINVVAIAAGGSHNLALRSDGTVVAWGDNSSGQSTIPDGLNNVVAIAAGGNHSLALRSDGTVVAWGAGLINDGGVSSPSNNYGQSIIPAGVYLPATVSGSVNANTPGSYALNYSATNFLGGSGSTTRTVVVVAPFTLTYAAGANGSLTGTTPQTVNYGASGTAVTAVAAPGYHFANWSDSSTANPRTDTNVTASQSVTANFVLNTPTPPVPTVTLTGPATQYMAVNTAYTELGAFSGPSALDAGQSHSLALRSDGTVAAWGTDYFGETAIPDGLSSVVAISAGQYFNLALRSDGTVAAWGYADNGQLNIPAGLSNVVALAAGQIHSLALRSDGTVVGWGGVSSYFDYGQANIPDGLSSVVAIAAGTYHSLALRSDGTVAAWGYYVNGQTAIPPTLSNVVAIAAGLDHSLALRSDGTVVAWGANGSGQTNIPAGLSNVVAIAAGGSESLALRSDGTVVGWGSYQPPSGLSNVVAIAAGGFESLVALRSDGRVVAWGYNGNIPANIYLPATVSGSVDTSTPGSYVLTYHATNFMGGSSSTTRTVVVLAPLNLTYTAGANGSLIGTPLQTVNYSATARGTAITAVPATGYHFVSWSDGATANPRTDILPVANVNVTANFAIGGNTLTYTAGAHGSLTGATPQTVNHGSAGTTVTAVPATSYSFVSWSDGATSNPRTDTNVMMNVNATANFRLNTPGNLDPDFYPDANGTVLSVAVQPDGKVLIGGSFTTVLGVARNRIARLNADGTLDMDFDPNASSNVLGIAVQADGKVLIGGTFTTLQPNGAATATTRNRIARLHADGSLDMGFDPNASGGPGGVFSLAVQADGKVLIGGAFLRLQPNGAATATARLRFARLNADGTLDEGFNFGVNNYVYSIAVQADGKVLIGGAFGTPRFIARLNANGTLDTGFNPYANGSVQSMVVQADGKVLIGGVFTTLQPNGAATATPRNSIARLHADGTLDDGFNPNANGGVQSMAVQADGKVLIGGNFGALQPNGAATATTRNRIARLNADGTLDPDFNPNANSTVNSLAVQSDGKVLIGGEFTTLQPNGAATATTRNRIARLDNDAAMQTLSIPSATQALWSRGGAAPELTRVTFEVTTDGGATWGTPIAGTRLGTTANWQATGLAIPPRSLLRARGVTSGGSRSSSSGLIEQVTSFSTLTYTAGAGGSLTGTTPQFVVPGANGTAVTAVASIGYHFANWSDGSTANPRTDTNVTADLSVTASFLPNPAPEVDFLSPATGLTTGGTSVTIYGINFLGASSVTFGGTEATIVSVTDTEITVTSPAHAAGPVNVVVTTPGGSSTDVPTFTYIAPLSALDTWRSAWYGPGATNTGNAANTADPYHTGIPNLLVFAFFGPNQDPATAQIRLLPQVSASGGFLSYHFSEPVGVSGLSYGAEWSTTLQAGDWQAVTDMGVTPGEHLFRVPMDGAKKFLRLVVMPTP